MTQYNSLNVKLSNSQINRLKSVIKTGPELRMNLSSNLIGNSKDETSFPNKLLLTDTKVSKIPKTFANGSSANIKFLKAQFFKMIHLGYIYDIFLSHSTDIFAPPIRPITEVTSLANLMNSSFKKPLKNTGTKKLNDDILVDTGLNIIGKNIKKRISSIKG